MTCDDCSGFEDRNDPTTIADPRTTDDRRHDRSVYLDSVYEEVQNDLRDLIKRSRADEIKRNNS